MLDTVNTYHQLVFPSPKTGCKYDVFSVIIEITFNMLNQHSFSHFPDDRTEPHRGYMTVCVYVMGSQGSGVELAYG